MTGTKHTDDMRAAVMAAFLAGGTIGQIMRDYDIPKATAARWRKEAFRMSADMSEEIGDMLLRYLATNLETLISQAETFKNQRWLLTQSASDVAVLHGVMTDKAIRLIEALSKHAEPPESETPAS